MDKADQVMKFDDVDAVSVFRYRQQIPGQPPAFLQCGGFIYPLIPGKSPILKSGDKMYMFPDLRKEGKGWYVVLWGGGGQWSWLVKGVENRVGVVECCVR